VLLIEVPDEFAGRQIEHAQRARGFEIVLDRAEPWGSGLFEGRVEARGDRRHPQQPIVLSVRCKAAWLDVAPQLVGQKRFLSLTTYWDLRTRALPMWIEEDVWVGREELGSLADVNWLHFAVTAPPVLPRALEATFVSFRWRIEASRRRLIGRETASHPLLLLEQRDQPVVRVETSPLGSWRLLDWRSEEEHGDRAGPCSVSYEPRQPEDMPLPGETPEQELARRATAR
jgi:hypothetical protein